MSSVYYVYCASHDPVMLIGTLDRMEDMRHACVMGFTGHENCDMVLIRVSGAPVEVGCPGIKNNRCTGHLDVRWLDADVARLLYYAKDDERKYVQALKSRPVFRCWSKDRLERLRNELDLSKGDA